MHKDGGADRTTRHLKNIANPDRKALGVQETLGHEHIQGRAETLKSRPVFFSIMEASVFVATKKTCHSLQ